MGNSSLKVLWDYELNNLDPEKNTVEHQNSHEHYESIIKDIKKIDYNLASAIDEASNDLAGYEMYQAFVLGFNRAVGLLMGCAQ
ncbi:hypothetical protein Q5O14_01945 [Eubacteriaceae bacterium ES2]|nr:hypothetical protein Q5O14_01945 [Eubacteriaceae bacterium ES2]